MTTQNLQTHILEAVHENGFENARLTDTPEGIGMDSLDAIEIIVRIENTIAREILDEWISDGLRKKTFAELATLLEARLKE